MNPCDFNVHALAMPTMGSDMVADVPLLLGPDGTKYGYERSGLGKTELSFCLDQVLETKPSGKILDFGCASGARAEEFALLGWTVVAADIAMREPDIAARNARLRRSGKPEIRFLQCDFLEDSAMNKIGRGYNAVNAGLVIHFFTLPQIERITAMLNAITDDRAVLALSFISVQPICQKVEGLAARRRIRQSIKVRMRCGTTAYSHNFEDILRLVRKGGFENVTDVFLDTRMKGLIARKRRQGGADFSL